MNSLYIVGGMELIICYMNYWNIYALICITLIKKLHNFPLPSIISFSWYVLTTNMLISKHNSKDVFSACGAGDAGETGLIPGWGRCPGVGHGNPLPVFFQGESHNSGAWSQSWTQLKQLSMHTFFCIKYLLMCSWFIGWDMCLSMNRCVFRNGTSARINSISS